MNKQIKAAVSIARGSDDKIRIYIEDEASSVQFVELSLDYESFAKALTGLHGIRCDGRVNGLEYVGKKRVVESRAVVCPLNTYKCEELEQWIIDNCQEEGWLVSSYLRSQSSVIRREGKTILNYRVVKYVEEV